MLLCGGGGEGLGENHWCLRAKSEGLEGKKRDLQTSVRKDAQNCSSCGAILGETKFPEVQCEQMQ